MSAECWKLHLFKRVWKLHIVLPGVIIIAQVSLHNWLKSILKEYSCFHSPVHILKQKDWTGWTGLEYCTYKTFLEKSSKCLFLRTYSLDTVQDFLIKLGIKPSLHILKISNFSLNHVIVRPTKIMSNLLKVCKNFTFKVIFRHQNSIESCWFFFSVNNIWLEDQLLLMKFFENFDF